MGEGSRVGACAAQICLLPPFGFGFSTSCAISTVHERVDAFGDNMSVTVGLLLLFEKHMVQQLLDGPPKVVFILFQGVADIECFHCWEHLFQQIFLLPGGKLVEPLIIVFPMLPLAFFSLRFWERLDSQHLDMLGETRRICLLRPRSLFSMP